MKLLATAAFAGALVCASNAAKLEKRGTPEGYDGIDYFKGDPPVLVKSTVFANREGLANHGYSIQHQRGGNNEVMEDGEEENGDMVAQKIGGIWSDPEDVQDDVKVQELDEEDEEEKSTSRAEKAQNDSHDDKSKQEEKDVSAASEDKEDNMKAAADEEEEDVQAAANEEEKEDEMEAASNEESDDEDDVKAALNEDSDKEGMEEVQAASAAAPTGSAMAQSSAPASSAAAVPSVDIKAVSSSMGTSARRSASASAPAQSSTHSDAMVFSQFINPSVILTLAGALTWILA